MGKESVLHSAGDGILIDAGELGERLLLEAEDMIDDLVDWRRDFHQFPELAFEEQMTSQRIVEVLQALPNMEVITGFSLATAVVGVVGGDKPGKAIALRAEMDAAAMQEETGLPFSSCVSGVAHVQGHDAHMSALLGAASLVAHHASELKHPVVFLFQPAEEGKGGAKLLVEAGFVERFNVGKMFAVQWWPQLAYGHVMTRKGALTACSSRIHIEIQGRGGHGALPHLTIDPMLVAANIQIGLQNLLSREVNPQETVVLSFGRIEAGELYNVIPDYAHLWGTLRVIGKELRAQICDRIAEFVKTLARAYGASANVDFSLNYDQMYNDPALVDEIRALGRSMFGDEIEEIPEPLLTGVDFSFFAEKVPACIMFLGTDMQYGLYHSRYDVPENLLPFAAAWEACIAMAIDGNASKDEGSVDE